MKNARKSYCGGERNTHLFRARCWLVEWNTWKKKRSAAHYRSSDAIIS
jgi:hypothetical protein